MVGRELGRLRLEVSLRIVAPGYFDVLGVPVLRGRTFTEVDTVAAPPVAMVNDAMARRFWRDGDPLTDRAIAFPGLVPQDEPARQIIGVVADVRDGAIAAPVANPTIYVPLAQLLDRETALVFESSPLVWLVRVSGHTHTLAAAVADELRRSTGLAAGAATSLDDTVVASSAEARFSMVILVIFGVVALTLAGMGVFGVMSSSVQRRAPEISVRLALGAAPADGRQMVVLDAMRLVVAGAAVGLIAAFALAAAIERSLFGVTSRDPLVFTGAAAGLIAIALVAAWIPARRAARSDPRESIQAP